MRRHLWLAVAMLLVGVGCPEEFGIGGRLDQAMAKDTKEMLEKPCPPGTQREEPKLNCADPSCTPPPKCVPKK